MRKKILLFLIPVFLMAGCENTQDEQDVGQVENLVIETIEPNTTGKITVYVDGIADFEYAGEIKIKNVPETCKDCLLHSYSVGCRVKRKPFEGYKAARPDWCPIEVKENDEQEK